MKMQNETAQSAIILEGTISKMKPSI